MQNVIRVLQFTPVVDKILCMKNGGLRLLGSQIQTRSSGKGGNLGKPIPPLKQTNKQTWEDLKVNKNDGKM